LQTKTHNLEVKIPKPSKGPSQNRDPIPLVISQWNGRSIQNETKINYVRSLPGDLIALQEIWQRVKEVETIGTLVNYKVRPEGNGGGTATIGKYCRIHIVSKFSINKDTDAIKVAINNYYLWLVNVYIHDGSISKIQKMLGKMRHEIPINEWGAILIIGDFNINADEHNNNFRLLKSLCKGMGLALQITTENTTEKSRLDYVITSTLIRINEYKVHKSISDHKAITWSFNLSPICKPTPIVIPDRELATAATMHSILNKKVKDTQDFLTIMKKLEKKIEF